MYGDVWVVAFVGKEWSNASSGIRGIVVSEFCEGEEFRLVVLSVGIQTQWG